MTGTALEWFQFYLSDRTQAVSIDGMSSKSCLLRFGVPQGSVAGPFEFIIYTGPVHDIAVQHGLCVHMYVDDTQIYIEFDLEPMAALEATKKMEACVADICSWM